jgi:hypothetical protein
VKFSGWTPFPAADRILSAELTAMGEGRPSGLHLSQVLHSWKEGLGEKVGQPEGDQDGVRLIEGFLWETAVEYMLGGCGFDDAMGLAFKRYMRALRSDLTTQIKVEKDGIHMTPDGVDQEKGELESYKFTRKSFKKASKGSEFQANFWPWYMQESAYLWAMGYDTATLIVCFAAGDYTGGPGDPPKILQGTGVYSPEELKSNWDLIRRHAERMGK